MRQLLAGLLFICSLAHTATGLAADPAGPLSGGAEPASRLDQSPGGFPGAITGADILPVETAYQLEVEIQDDQSIRAYWHIEEGYYLYQHRFDFKLSDGAASLPLEVRLPEALERSDEFFGDVRVYYHAADITLLPQQFTARATLQVKSQGCADAGLCYPPQTEAFELDFAAGTVTPVAAGSRGVEPGAESPGSARGLLYMLLLAFVGGSILNLMPCVFPILSLKVLSFARSEDHDRHLHGWAYAAGVVASFVLVAAVLIALQQAGRAIGWGFQLQSPGFVIALAYLFIAMGLSLSGLVQLGGSVMGAGSSLADRSGLSGSFFTGVLAVVVASPCTAPFMGSALGFAVTQPAHIGLLVFVALGAGMAAPLLLLSYSKWARRIMPRPGPWMETLKQLLAFPLYATAIWLLWVAGRQTGVNTMATALGGALVLAMGLWFWGQGSWRRILAAGCLVLAAALGAMRGLDDDGARESQLARGKVPWSEQKIAQLRSEGKPVFLDVTADWCITCLANESAVLLTPEMTEAFAQHGVVYMVADWTNYDADIARFLEKHGRTGIPLYLMYPADPALEPLVLPQLLTSNTVLEALRAVSSKKTEVAAKL
jgi:thiol:disulfide interchange protein DsbD